jgi:hypothetical protein
LQIALLCNWFSAEAEKISTAFIAQGCNLFSNGHYGILLLKKEVITMRVATVAVCSIVLLASGVHSAPIFKQQRIDSRARVLVQAAERNFTLINKTGNPVNSVSAKQAATSGAQDVALIGTALAAGASTAVNINISGNACVFDVTVVMSGATPKLLRGVDLCQTDALTLE